MPLADFDYLEFLVSNASQSAFWYCSSFGFKRFAHKKTGNSYSVATRNGKITFLFTSYLQPSEEDKQYMLKHGDSVRDVAFRVDDLVTMKKYILEGNASVLEDISNVSDEFGVVELLKIEAHETDLTHTLIDRSRYSGLFLPGFEKIEDFPLLRNLSNINILLMDHVVQNYPIDTVSNVEKWYLDNLNLKRFWSIDDKLLQSNYSPIKTLLVTNEDRNVQMTLVESAKRNKTDQIVEFLEFNDGSGIQHIAFLVEDIVSAIELMKERSVEFLTVPSTYYDMLEDRLKNSKLDFQEDLEKIRKLHILVDFDDNGYLLQIFTKPCQDRPTLFIELIQRHNFNGFGAGNVKALFEAVAREQELRKIANGEQIQ